MILGWWSPEKLPRMAFVFMAFVLQLENGRIPAASGGDEMRIGDGGCRLLKDGVHACGFLADAAYKPAMDVLPQDGTAGVIFQKIGREAIR